MPERLFLSRTLLLTGGVLLVIGLMLWLALPIRPMLPPYLGTTFLAFGYGLWCRRKIRPTLAPLPKS